MTLYRHQNCRQLMIPQITMQNSKLQEQIAFNNQSFRGELVSLRQSLTNASSSSTINQVNHYHLYWMMKSIS
jgi:hypothetical protein